MLITESNDAIELFGLVILRLCIREFESKKWTEDTPLHLAFQDVEGRVWNSCQNIFDSTLTDECVEHTLSEL